MSIPVALNGVGISYRTAPLELRETLSFTADELPHALADLRRDFGTGVILATCNRTEIYVSTPPSDNVVSALIDFVHRVKGVDSAHALSPSYFYVLDHDNAARHLYRVASGIDSMVLGEAQILGQVRGALSAAHRAGSLDGVLSRLLHQAIRVGKRVRHETAIGRYAVSVSSAAARLAQQELGGLQGRTVLVISAGEAGKLAARSLSDQGAQLLVTSRNYRRARRLAGELGGEALPFARLNEGLIAADVVISSTGASSLIVGYEQVAAAIKARPQRRLLMIDIAVPRDIDPQVRELTGVRLFDIDDLHALLQDNLRRRHRELAKVESIIEQEVKRFHDWYWSLDVVTTIARLHQRADEIRRAELERTLSRLTDLPDQERQRIEAMSIAIVKKLLHHPIARLRGSENSRQYAEVVRHLFDLPDYYEA